MSERMKNKRGFSTMPPHNLMSHSIPHIGKRDGRLHASRSDRKPAGVPHAPRHFDQYIGPVDVMPGNPSLIIAELRGVIVTGEFVPQPAKTPEDTLVLAANARIGLSQEGFIAVSAGSDLLKMRVGDAGGLLQEVS